MRPFADSIDCAAVSELLEAFVDSELEVDAADAVRVHLESCRHCADEHRSAVELQSGLRALPILDVPEGVLQAVDRVVDGESSEPKPRHSREVWFRPVVATVALAASIVLVVGLDPLDWRPEPGPSQTEADWAAAEARLAVAYVVDITRRAEVAARSRVIEDAAVATTIRSVTRSLQFRSKRGGDHPVADKTPETGIEGSS